MKKIMSLLIVLALLATGLVIAAFAAEDAVIAVEKVEAEAGEEVTLEVVITGNPGFGAASFLIEYDETALTLVGVDTTDCLLAGAAENDTVGAVSFAAADNVTADGTLFTITFQVKEGVADGEYAVSVTVRKIINADREAVAHTVEAGSVTVAHTCALVDVAEVPATCTENGVKAHQVCSVCGKLYIDGVEVTEADLVIAAGHTPGEVVIENATEGTCTEGGTYDEVVYCTVCGEELSRTTVTVTAGGHTAGEVVIENVVEATCTTDGSYDEVVYCSVCDAELSRTTVTVTAGGHTAGEAVIENVVEATCTEDGSYDVVVYCTVCDEELSRETVIVPAHGHEFVDGKCIHCGEEDPDYEAPDTGSVIYLAVVAAVTSMAGIVALTKKKEF